MLKIIQKIKTFFFKPPEEEKPIVETEEPPIKRSGEDEIFSIKFMLSRQYDVDLFLEMNDIIIEDNEAMEILSQRCGEFLYSINSGVYKKNIIGLILDELEGERYHQFIEKIIFIWTALEEKEAMGKIKNSKNRPFIRPTEVFSRYTLKNS